MSKKIIQAIPDIGVAPITPLFHVRKSPSDNILSPENRLISFCTAIYIHVRFLPV